MTDLPPDRIHILLITIDGFVVDARCLNEETAQSPMNIIFRLTCWGEDAGYAYCQGQFIPGDDIFQLDFVTRDGTAGTAIAAVYSATRH